MKVNQNNNKSVPATSSSKGGGHSRDNLREFSGRDLRRADIAYQNERDFSEGGFGGFDTSESLFSEMLDDTNNPNVFLADFSFQSAPDNFRIESATDSAGRASSMDMQDAQPEGEMSFVSDTIIQKLQKTSAPRDMNFTMENSLGRVEVTATMQGSTLRCGLRPSNDNLRRKLIESKHRISTSISSALQRLVELDIEGEE